MGGGPAGRGGWTGAAGAAVAVEEDADAEGSRGFVHVTSPDLVFQKYQADSVVNRGTACVMQRMTYRSAQVTKPLATAVTRLYLLPDLQNPPRLCPRFP